MRVLVIDDSEDFRTRVTQYLAAAMPDAELTLWNPAAQGKPTIGFDWRRYDALLLDDSPGAGADGLEWLTEFRAEGPVPPTLVLSDTGGEDMMRHAHFKPAADARQHLGAQDIEKRKHGNRAASSASGSATPCGPAPCLPTPAPWLPAGTHRAPP